MFPSTARRPARADYWGEEIESFREFSPATQLSTQKLGAVEVHPARELLPSADVRRRAEEALPRYRGHYRALLEQLSAGLVFEGMEQALPLIFDRLPSFTDLLPAQGWVVVASAPAAVGVAGCKSPRPVALTSNNHIGAGLRARLGAMPPNS